jgi:hemolysin activation/secretion protein
MERGVLEGGDPQGGANGFQLILGGMRSGNGTTFGVGYRRSDLWQDWLGARVTARGTLREATMFDLTLDVPRWRPSRANVKLYVKYENSPRMDFYGEGPDSSKENRSSYRLEDFRTDLEARYRIFRHLNVGIQFGGLWVNTGEGNRSGVPSPDEIFNPAEIPGLAVQTNFIRTGGFLQYDCRDTPGGPRSGGNYYIRYSHYSDQKLNAHSYQQTESAVEQYFPYFNRTRVVALRLGTKITYAYHGQTVPFYLQPTLGGNEFLRGFARYRFTDANSILATAEHRWFVGTGFHAALFFEGGKVANKAHDLNFHHLEYAGGIGLRFTILNNVIMRIDNGFSREGYRFIWTFSNMW